MAWPKMGKKKKNIYIYIYIYITVFVFKNVRRKEFGELPDVPLQQIPIFTFNTFIKVHNQGKIPKG